MAMVLRKLLMDFTDTGCTMTVEGMIAIPCPVCGFKVTGDHSCGDRVSKPQTATFTKQKARR